MTAAREAFRSALKKGTGRAMVLLRAEPEDPDFHADLLEACRTNLVHDSQCEAERAPYLCDMIRETGAVRAFWNALLPSLIRAPDQRDALDQTQVFHVLCGLAAEEAEIGAEWQVLQDFLLSAGFDDVARDCMEPFVQLRGMGGLLVCFLAFSDRLGREEWNADLAFRSLLDTLAERDGPELAAEALQEARSRSVEFDTLMRMLGTPEHAEHRTAAHPSRAEVVETISRSGRLPVRWAHNATPDDVRWAAGHLLAALNSRDEAQMVAWLQVFRLHDFPGPAEALFEAAREGSYRLARAAATALSRIGRPDVRSLALELIGGGTRVGNGITMLASNLQPGDFMLIDDRLAEAESDVDLFHGLGRSLLDMLRNQPSPPKESRPALLRLYEAGPCSNCRDRVVRCLETAGGVPDWMDEECRYDCNPAIAARFRVIRRRAG